MKRAVIYARYSCSHQTEQSIEGQLTVCNSYAEREGFTIVSTYIDRAMTGRNDFRPDFQRMIKDSANHTFDYVLVYKLDRFARNNYDHVINKKKLKDNGVTLVSACENISDSPDGILLESIYTGLNQYYSAELSEKVKRGNAESRKKGFYTGGYLLYGYKVIDKKYQINDDEAIIVNRIFDEYLSGKMIKEIIEGLNNDNILNKGVPFIKSKITKILSNRKYTGKCNISGTDYDNLFPMIIDEEKFERVQKLLDKKKHKNAKGKAITEYYLSGKLICGRCGSEYVGSNGKSHTGKTYFYYMCSGKKDRNRKCNNTMIRKEQIEKFVFDAIQSKLCEPQVFNEIVDETFELCNTRAKNNQELKNLNKALSEVEKKISNYLKAIEMGIFNEETQNAMNDLIVKKNDYLEKIAIAKAQSARSFTKEEIIKYLESFKKLDYNNPAEIKYLFNVFLKNVIVADGGEIIIICNTISSNNEKTKPLNYKRFGYQSNGGARGIRTLAPVTRSTSLAGKPLEPLEYYSTTKHSFIIPFGCF